MEENLNRLILSGRKENLQIAFNLSVGMKDWASAYSASLEIARIEHRESKNSIYLIPDSIYMQYWQSCGIHPHVLYKYASISIPDLQSQYHRHAFAMFKIPREQNLIA